ncbi:hypothetical protein Goshw_003927 [Gossypium schwendimanii]|uniref:Major facilitator superfamily (MFS) profile domain-containing protein n=2 Tax=Gossypium TaxID=3633 RepID=A0A7J9M0P2_GOSSC|nr:hypothetical protein [Gossypium schwendimanii]
MAWFSGKVSLGGFPDIAGAVNKFQESVKNIEKNFDNALGFEEKSESNSNEASGLWPSDRKALFDPVMSFMGQKGEENAVESSGKLESSQDPPKAVEKEEAETGSSTYPHEKTSVEDDKAAVKLEKENKHSEAVERADTAISDSGKAESEPEPVSTEPSQTTFQNVGSSDSPDTEQQKESFVMVISDDSDSKEAKLDNAEVDQVEDAEPVPAKSSDAVDILESKDEQKTHTEEISDKSSPVKSEESSDRQDDAGAGPEESVLSNSHSISVEETNSVQEFPLPNVLPSYEAQGTVSESAFVGNDANTEKVEVNEQTNDSEADVKEEMHMSSATIMPASVDSMHELEKVMMEMKMMESALQGAARQAQAKADEIAKLMNENEQLKAVIEDLKRKSNEAEMESLQEEYRQRVSTLERKVYALTKERDALRREQNKKSDAAALLKEKDEIIKQVMAEGEELSKKQATQESLIRKLRAQIRELEEEKKGLTTKLQASACLRIEKQNIIEIQDAIIFLDPVSLVVEENKVESIKKDKTATEKLLQETIEKHQVELAAQKDFYTNALNAAREAEALAEARANNEARTELESRLREAEERESMLVQTLEELRQTLSRKEQQAVFREDMLRRDIEDLQKRYQASERRCEELITQVPESTRPLLRQIEAMQVVVLWLMYVLFVETFLDIGLTFALLQISCLRAEQTQLSRSLEKERQRAAEQRQEYLAAKEEADTQEVRANQLEEEIRELRRKHKQELQDALVHRELLQQEVEREKAARADLERTVRVQSTELAPIARHNSTLENGSLSRKLSTTSSIESMEESYYLQASLDSSDGFSEKRNIGETALSPLYMKSMTPSAFESALRQKEGELASYMSRLTSLESIRDSLSEELVKMTAQCEKLKAEAATLPGIRAELEALRRRHSAALELMGERDEELEELRADIVDLKEMYREQVNLLVNKLTSESFAFRSGESVYNRVEMRGRHVDSYSMYKRGTRDHVINTYDYDKEQVRLLSGVGKDIGNPSWKRSFPYILLAALSSFLFGYHLGVVNGTLESMSHDLGFHGDTMAEGLVVSTCLGGAFVGSLFSGSIADGVGRRRAFQLCALPLIIGSSMSATAKNLWGMLLGRLFVGTGMGIGPPVAALYVAEVSPAYVRGTYGSCSQLATCLGLMGALFIGFPAKQIEGWWRMCFWASVTPAALLTLFMEFSVESPHWLFKRGRGADAEAGFEKLLGGPYVKGAMAELSKSQRGDEADTVKLSELFYGRHRKVVFMGSSLFALQQLSGINAVFYFSSTVFKSAGVPSESANICVGIANLLGSLFALVSMDKLGRKALLIASFSGMAVAMTIQATSASSLVSGSSVIYLSVGGMLLFVLTFAMGAGPVPGLLLSEMFPSRVRAKAMSICMAVHWMINSLVGLLFLRLLELLGPLVLNTIFATFCLLAVIFVKKNVLETKGKSLQDIEIALLPPV